MQIIRSNTIRTEQSNISEVNREINKPASAGQQMSFQDVLTNRIDVSKPLQFSKHASMRLSSREIELSPDQLKRVENGVDKARAKGINDSLVMIDDIALVVNIRNKVVITALGRENENVFTNIDGAVIV